MTNTHDQALAPWRNTMACNRRSLSDFWLTELQASQGMGLEQRSGQTFCHRCKGGRDPHLGGKGFIQPPGSDQAGQQATAGCGRCAPLGKGPLDPTKSGCRGAGLRHSGSSWGPRAGWANPAKA